MKKIFVLISAILISFAGMAQKSAQRHATRLQSNSAARTTATGDTSMLSNIATGDNVVLYSAGADSGYLTGINYWGDWSFAESYSIDDSAMLVIGVFTQFGGTVNPASANSVTLNVWNAGSPQYITSGLFNSGFPSTVLLSKTVPFTQLGIGATADTMKLFLFDSTTAWFSGNLFFGYNMNYNFSALAGDTIGPYSSEDGDRSSAATFLNITITDIDTLVDTMINVQNATQWSDGTWHDNYTDNDSLFNDLAIYPVVIMGFPLSSKGITKHNFTFYGSYPNPAVNTANIKFALARGADVTIQVMDMAGRVISTINHSNLATGEHTIPVNTSALPSGNYLYLIRTSGGDGIASKMTVIK
jgi:hypothetical protein